MSRISEEATAPTNPAGDYTQTPPDHWRVPDIFKFIIGDREVTFRKLKGKILFDGEEYDFLFDPNANQIDFIADSECEARFVRLTAKSIALLLSGEGPRMDADAARAAHKLEGESFWELPLPPTPPTPARPIPVLTQEQQARFLRRQCPFCRKQYRTRGWFEEHLLLMHGADFVDLKGAIGAEAK